MISPVTYDPVNFQPICIDNVQVPESVFKLASLSPSFSPTPSRFHPPDGNELNENLMEFKRILSWTYMFRIKEFNESASVDEFLNAEFIAFKKCPWYVNSTAKPPPLPTALEVSFERLYLSIMQPKNWYKFQQNLSPELRQAISLVRNLPDQDIGTYCQDKSARICFASLSKTNEKVEMVLSDESKYEKLPVDMARSYQSKIKHWYQKHKAVLKSIPDDITNFISPEAVSTPHLKVLVKTHKPGCPVRITFSSIGSSTSNLSTTLDHSYLKPIINNGLCSRRLGDTRDALLFVENVNDYLWKNDITDRPTIFAMDVVNFFPSVPFSLASSAVSHFLKAQGLLRTEISAVVEGLKVIRNGNFFKWKSQFYTQISGCALGDPDSCSYSDISMAHLLNNMVPACETGINVKLDPFFKIFRDDGLGFVFGDPAVIVDICEFFNKFNKHIQWTIPVCKCCATPEVLCPDYNHLEFLDCNIYWKQVPKGECLVWQFSVKSYSKSTDCHAYLSPQSCSSPHLNSKGVSVAKTVGTRLRSIHSSDHDLLLSLNLYAGYLIARGYNPTSIKYHLCTMANRSREVLLAGGYKPREEFILPLVTELHPAITVLSKIAKTFLEEASSMDPIIQYVLPSTSLTVAYRKLPNLQLLLCKNDQNSLVDAIVPAPPMGYVSSNCQCLVCKASLFSKFVSPPSLPGYSIRLPQTTNCRSGPSIVYYLICTSGRPECRLAHYVGKTHTNIKGKHPMHLRWSCHKSHHKNGYNFCKMTDHLMKFHKNEDPQSLIKIQILESTETEELALEKDIWWQRKLFSFYPSGLNVREESVNSFSF